MLLANQPSKPKRNGDEILLIYNLFVHILFDVDEKKPKGGE